jgi:hypothetical protein
MRYLLVVLSVLLAAAVGCAPPQGQRPAPPKEEKFIGPRPEPQPVRPSPSPASLAARNADVPTYYMRAGKAHIVYTAEDTGAGLHAVEIWISADGGKKWEPFAEDKEVSGRVLFEAKKEGSFEFVSVGVDKIGNREKELSPTTRPSFRVVVDRTAPKVTVAAPPARALSAGNASFIYTWSAEDPHLGDRPVALQFKLKKATAWQTVAGALPAKGKQKFDLPEARDDVAELRFAARDLAGNEGYGSAGAVAFDRVAPVAKILGPATAEDMAVKVKYEVSDPGEAELASVALWITDNRGRSWRKLADAPPKTGEVLVHLPGPGAFGLAISAADSVGNVLPPPRRGTRPSFELSTDRKAPVLEALGWVSKGQLVSSRKGVEVKWKATDKNIAAKPVTMQFSADGGRTWNTVGGVREASGSFKWSPPKNVDSRHCLLRLIARDQLGNESQLVSPPFTVDNKPPTTSARLQPVTDEEKKPEEKKPEEKKKPEETKKPPRRTRRR